MTKVVFVFLFIPVFCFSQFDEKIRLNQIRILASHNSYKGLPNPKVLRFLDRIKDKLGEENNPIQLDYGHVSLKSQLNDYGVRGFELDIYHDPKGKSFRKRKINAFIWGLKQRVKNPKIKVPGFKLIHIPDVDYETNYILLKDALIEIKEWSDDNPNHVPVFINIEASSYTLRNESFFLKLLGFSKTVPFDLKVYEELDREILDVFPPSTQKIVTPKNITAIMMVKYFITTAYVFLLFSSFC